MLRVDYARWNQSPDDLRQQALEAGHGRTRGRFFALYEISQGRSTTQVAQTAQRNADGPEALGFVRTGGHPSFVRR